MPSSPRRLRSLSASFYRSKSGANPIPRGRSCTDSRGPSMFRRSASSNPIHDDVRRSDVTVLEFSHFDRRRYPTVSVKEGYRAWLPSYETTVEDEMDLVLLDALETVAWPAVRHAADLGCGTGRTGAWLRSHGITRLDGIDVTPEMLAVARGRHVYEDLAEADIAATGLESGIYELVTTCLVDEHLRDLRPLYRETARLLQPGGHYVLVGYHP